MHEVCSILKQWGTSVDVTEIENGGRRECFQNNHQEQTALPINMSVVPLMFRDWWDDFDRPTRLMDQHFAMGLRRDDLLSSLNPLLPLRSSGYLRPWRHLNRQDSGGVSSITTEKDKFQSPQCECKLSPVAQFYMSQVILDVQQFSPSEITVKTVGNEVIVEAKHEEKQDEHGYVSRHFLRRYLLPTDIEVKDVVSSLSSDGVLTVTAPKKDSNHDPPVISSLIQHESDTLDHGAMEAGTSMLVANCLRRSPPLPAGERSVPIIQTGVPAMKPATESQVKIEQPSSPSVEHPKD
uniref:SHSP domain-containing protein n=1 Tax=Timema cristinae TaxID=61476 RepID=A0A7R9CXP3_TIMCR|nr:unnamed protein product [Timema cristinae]